MTNNEKALELVQKCLDDWPYAATMVIDIMNRLEQVKALLKEQEPVKPRHTPPKSIYSWECGVCAEPFDRIANYCPKCGRGVKWE